MPLLFSNHIANAFESLRANRGGLPLRVVTSMPGA